MEKKHVYSAIAEVAKKIAGEGISKSRKNTSQNYNFRGIDEIYNALATHLADSELVIIPRILNREFREVNTKSGGVMSYVVVEAEYDFISAKDGSTHTARVIGEAMDSADKATNKAMSAAYKYLCLQTFCIPTEGDNDADAHTPERVQPKIEQKNNVPLVDQIAACNTKKCLVDLYNKNKKEVDGNPQLKSLMAERQKTLNAKTVGNETSA